MENVSQRVQIIVATVSGFAASVLVLLSTPGLRF